MHRFGVTAVGNDGLRSTTTVTYTVTAPHQASGRTAGLTFTLTVPGRCVSPGGSLPLAVTKMGSTKRFRVASYSFFIDTGKPGRKPRARLVAIRAGRHAVALHGIRAGEHKLTLAVLLRSTAKPKQGQPLTTKSLRLTLRFAVC